MFKHLRENLALLRLQQEEIDGVCARGVRVGGGFSWSGTGAVVVYSGVASRP